MVYGASDSEIIVFEAETGRPVRKVEVFGPSAVSPTMALRGGIDSFSVDTLPDLAAGKLTRFVDLGYPKSDVLGFATLSTDGVGTFVSGVASRSTVGANGKFVSFAHEKFSVTSLAAAAGGSLFAMGALNGEVRWINPDGTTAFSVDAKAGAVTSMGFSPKADGLVIGTGDGSVKIYRGTPWWVKAQAACGGMVFAVAWNPTGNLIAAGAARTGGGRLHLINPESGAVLAKADMPSGIYALGFSKSGECLLLGCEDGAIRVKAVRR